MLYMINNMFICICYDVKVMSQSYNKPCMFCKQEIVMSDGGASGCHTILMGQYTNVGTKSRCNHKHNYKNKLRNHSR